MSNTFQITVVVPIREAVSSIRENALVKEVCILSSDSVHHP